MDTTYKQEVRVGALVLFGFATFVALLFWLTDRRVGAQGVRVTVRFDNVAGLDQGDPVMVSGVKVGRVEGVRLQRGGKVDVILNVTSDQRPRIDATAAIGALDFLGSKFIRYSPGIREEELPDGRALTGTQEQELTDMASGVAQRANELLGNANTFVSPQLSQDLHNTMVAVQRAMNLLSDAPNGPFVTQTTKTLAATERVMQRVDSLLGSSTGKHLDSLTTNLATLTNHLGSATVAIDTLLRRMNRGEGTLGKLASDSTLYTDLHNLSVALTALLTDLKEHPDKYMKPGLIRVKMF
ncbi:MAG TPA: MlaD family protein [Gemmatimonadales bacterium]|jgi:phospholipid/cholesterol/gamma-HCH transport system substrate-binding protein|nr:MlaD family protein [Gemmatimonadales bacterium]